MTEYLIGTGGWGYFDTAKDSSLQAYSRIFNFVEVNYSFYHYPSAQKVEKWRHSVPDNFNFSVRCHRDLTHRIGLKPNDEAYEVFYKMSSYCRILESSYLVLQTPASYIIEGRNIKEAIDFLSSLKLGGLRLIWEYRAPVTQTITRLMQDFNIIQSVDLSKTKPSYNLDVAYSRLFGKGQHNIYQFADEELIEIDKNAQDTKAKTVMLSYHGARMHIDAARHLYYKKTGKFLPVTACTGINSARAVLSEDTEFPITKNELKKNQGWKVIDLAEGKRVHLSELIEKMHDRTYHSLDEVLVELGAVI